MDYTNFKMSNKQINDFAKAIFADIQAYVEEHKKEYEEFLQNEANYELQIQN